MSLDDSAEQYDLESEDVPVHYERRRSFRRLCDETKRFDSWLCPAVGNPSNGTPPTGTQNISDVRHSAALSSNLRFEGASSSDFAGQRAFDIARFET